MGRYYHEGYLTEKEIRGLKSDTGMYKYICESCNTFVYSKRKYKRLINRRRMEVCKKCYEKP